MRLVALALALFLLPQDEKVTLKFNPKQGDKLTRTRKSEFKLVMELDAGGQVQDMEIEQRENQKSVIEYAGVEGGKVTKKVFDCLEDFEEKKQPPMMEWQRTDKAMHGRKVTVLLKDGQVAHEGAEGLTEKDLEKVRLDDPPTQTYPKEPLAVGETWELKDEQVEKFLESEQKFKKASMKSKLTSIKEIDKRRCAVFKTALEVVIEPEEGVEVKANIEGDLVIWIERGHLLEFKGKGKMTIKADNDQMSMDGKGDISMEMSAKVD